MGAAITTTNATLLLPSSMAAIVRNVLTFRRRFATCVDCMRFGRALLLLPPENPRPLHAPLSAERGIQVGWPRPIQSKVQVGASTRSP